MSSDLAVSIHGLGKTYTIRHQPRAVSLSEEITSAFRRRRGRDNGSVETFHALTDVEFDVERGDVVGIIGRNGAGKSTLLKILSRITEPTTGEVRVYGRVGALLEVGSGFHPELTGRENVFLNAAMLGMSRRDALRHFDEIVAFAEVEKFIDTPVKRYSSGMYVRLAFAVAAHVLPEILIVDEVLAVGDTAFQKKCLGKMGDAARDGRTVLFVSHNMQVVNALCRSAVLLEGGRVARIGGVGDVVRQYQASMAGTGHPQAVFEPWFPDFGLVAATVTQAGEDATLLSSRDTIVTMRIRAQGVPAAELVCGFRLVDAFGNRVLSTLYNDLDEYTRDPDFGGDYDMRCVIPANTLNEGAHRLHFMLAVHKVRGATDDDSHVLDFDVVNVDGVGSRFGLGRSWRDEPLLPSFPWSAARR